MSPDEVRRANEFLKPRQQQATIRSLAALSEPGRNDARLPLRRAGGPEWPTVDCDAVDQADRQGRHPKIGPDGKAIYSEFVGFASRAAGDRFRDMVLEAMRRSNPELFDAQGAP